MQPPAPVVIEQPAPVVVQAPAPPPVVYSADEYLIPRGTIEDGVHYGYLTDVGRMWYSFTFDRVTVNPDGTWTNAGDTLRTLPLDWEVASAPNYTPGLPIAVHVLNQHVVGVYEAYPVETCGC